MQLERRWPWIVLAALAPLWILGIFGRTLWTPDEPREADITWRMAHQSDRTLPTLAGVPFLEKPPLTYWASARATSYWGDSAAAARTPNLLYAAIVALAVGALGFTMRGARTAVVAALVAGSTLLVWRVGSWLAPDAALLAGTTFALLGAYRGFRAPPGPRKLWWYTLLHLGAAAGFMAKSAPGWLVPGLALLTLIAWERRWSELKRWELYAGLLVQALIIGPWILAVERLPQGASALCTLFWNNVIGRFAKVSAATPLDYTLAHKNWPGRYLIELPLSLLPWTLIVLAALRRAWDRAREPGPDRMAWRFGVAASLPFLLLISLAATARDIYAAPIVPGLSLLAALWATEGPASGFDRFAERGTHRIVAILAWVLCAISILFAAAGVRGAPLLAYGGAAIASLVTGIVIWRTKPVEASFLRLYVGYALVLCASALALFPVFDRWQNLRELAQEIHRQTDGKRLALLAPDETTIAMLDYRLSTAFTVLPGGAAADRSMADWFHAQGVNARVLIKLPGHSPGELAQFLARWHRVPSPGDPAAALEASGRYRMVARYELPQGRRYALVAPVAY